MRYMLDINIRDSVLKSRPLSVKARCDEMGPGALVGGGALRGRAAIRKPAAGETSPPSPW